MPLHPESPPLEQLIRIGPRLGSLKIEHSDVVAYTGLLKKSYVISKLKPPSQLVPSPPPQPAEPMEASSACSIVKKACHQLYPQAEDTGEVTIRFKGISRLDETLKANTASHIIHRELQDTLASNPKPNYLIEQRRLLLNQQGKLGIWESDPDKSYKKLAMQSSERFFDMENCVKLTPRSGGSTSQEAAPPQIKFSLRGGSSLDELQVPSQQHVEFAPVVMTFPFGYLPKESDSDKPINKILEQWRQNVSS